MFRNIILVLLALSGLALFVFAPRRAPGADPPAQNVVDTARGLFGVDVNVGDRGSVRVRAGLIDIHVGGDARRDGVPVGEHTSHWLFRGSKLINTPVMDPKHKEIGRVDDVVVDLRSGRVRYIAVEYPALLGRDKLFAVPWDRFQLARNKHGGFYLVVNIEEETFERAPGFVRNKWPNFANRRWQEEIDIFYGVYIKPGDVKTRFGTSPDPIKRIEHLERVSRIKGFPVIADESERRIGAVSDIVVDFASGHARYTVVCFKNSIGTDNRRFVIPSDQLDFEIEDGRPCLELEVKMRRMSRAPSFEVDQWPNLRDQEFTTSIDAFYAEDDD